MATRRPRRASRTRPLYRSCKAVGDSTAVITLRRANAAFLGALSLTSFAIQSPTAMAKYGANKGTLSKDGVFTPGGDYGVPGGQAVGTGPFKLESWKIGDKLVIVRNDSYWGKKAFLRRVIFRAIPDNAARLQALQTGEIQGYDLVEPQDIPTIQKDSKLKVLDRPAFNVAYVTHQPGGQAVRQPAGPPGGCVRPRSCGGRQVLLRGPRRGGERVHATAGRGVREGRPEVHLQPGEGEAAPPAGGADAAGRGGVLVPDGRLSSVHAGSGSGTSRRSPRA